MTNREKFILSRNEYDILICERSLLGETEIGFETRTNTIFC